MNTTFSSTVVSSTYKTNVTESLLCFLVYKLLIIMCNLCIFHNGLRNCDRFSHLIRKQM